MKKRISLTLAVLLLVSLLAACSSSNQAAETSAPATEAAETSAPVTEAAADDLLAQIQARGTIIVGLEGDWAPWSFVGDGDTLMGFDVEVAQAIAAKLGVKAEIVPGEWDGLFAGMDAGRYDIVVNGVEVTPDRTEKYDFTDPYAYIRTALIVRGDNEDIKSFEDLKGKTTANSIASTYMTLAEEYGATVSGVDTLDETLTMVLQGRVDATLNANVSFMDYLTQHPDADLKVVATTEDASLVAIPMRKGDYTASLLAAINKALAELHADGTISNLSVKYFGDDISKCSTDNSPGNENGLPDVRNIEWIEINAGCTYDGKRNLSGFLLQGMFRCDSENYDGFTVTNSFGAEQGHKPFYVDGAGYEYEYFSFWIPDDPSLEGWHTLTLYFDGTSENIEFNLKYLGDYSEIIGTPDSVAGLGWEVSEWRVIE